MASTSVPGMHSWGNLHYSSVLGALGSSPFHGGGLRAPFFCDRLPSVLVSTKKGGENKYKNAYRRISANVVSPLGAHARPHTALMHDYGHAAQQYYGGKTMKRLTAMAIVGDFLLAVVSR